MVGHLVIMSGKRPGATCLQRGQLIMCTYSGNSIVDTLGPAGSPNQFQTWKANSTHKKMIQNLETTDQKSAPASPPSTSRPGGPVSMHHSGPCDSYPSLQLPTVGGGPHHSTDTQQHGLISPQARAPHPCPVHSSATVQKYSPCLMVCGISLFQTCY